MIFMAKPICNVSFVNALIHNVNHSPDQSIKTPSHRKIILPLNYCHSLRSLLSFLKPRFASA